MLKSYIAKIETVGPLFIGNGQKIEKMEYVYDKKEQRIYVIDPHKMFEGLQKSGLLDTFEKFVFAQADNKAAWNTGKKKGQKPRDKTLTDFIKSSNISFQEYKNWAAYSYEVETPEDVGNPMRNDILACAKDAYGMPYVPGSSFKGALVNVLLSDRLLRSENKDLERKIAYAEFRGRTRYLGSEAEECLVNEFHKKRSEDNKRLSDATNSTLRGLVIGDSKPISVGAITLCQKLDVATDKTEKPMPVLRECIKPGTVIEIPIEIDTEVFDYSEADIEAAIKKVYANLSEKFLLKFPPNDLEPNEKEMQENNYMYLGGGTGYVQKTVTYALYHDRGEAVKEASEILHKVFYSPSKNAKASYHQDDYKKYDVSPRVRKCVYHDGKYNDFGLCKVTFQPL